MRRLPLSTVLLLIACSGSLTRPPSDDASLRLGDGTLRLKLSASKTQFHAGTPDTLRVTLTNDSPSAIVLHFGSSCQILPYIRDDRGAVVLPAGGGWACLTVLTQLALSAHQSVTREFVWTGGTSFSSGVPQRLLPPGTYYASAEVPQGKDTLRTAPLAITLTE